MAAPQPRRFEVNPKNANVPPLLMGFMGPPGGGKTFSALRIAAGICRVRGGKPLVIDTEAGRALRYHKDHGGQFDFDFIQFNPPFVPANFMDAIKQAVEYGAGCIIVDSLSDEHEGEGGVLDWHDAMVPQMGGNEWAAWSKPKASRRVLISGIQQIKVPLIATFRAREKTVTKPVTKNGRTRDQPVSIGYQPIAPMEIVHTLDLTCLLPPRANGVPLWNSPKEGEDFVIKLPEFLAPMIDRGAALDERLGEALGRWQLGKDAPPTSSTTDRKRLSPEEQVDAYIAAINRIETLDELREYQAHEARIKWVDGIKTSRADLYDRIITANSARATKLMPADDPEPEKDADDYPKAEADPDYAVEEIQPEGTGLFGGDD